MPINTSTHPSFDTNKSTFTQDAYNGDVDQFIPKLAGQTNQEYQAYVDRAVWVNDTKKTVTALNGTIFRKPFDTNVDTDTIFEQKTFEQFIQSTTDLLMLGGRVGILVDHDGETPTLTEYPNNSIVNWCSNYIVLREDYYVIDPDDRFEHKAVEQYKELTFDEDGYYIVNTWRESSNKQFEIVDIFAPTKKGERLDFIPFYYANTMDNSPTCAEPLVFNVAQINVSQYKTSADLEHALHFTALPQPWISGNFNSEYAESHAGGIPIGTFDVWALEQDTQVGYLEFTGAGIESIQTSIQDKRSQISSIGSQLIEGKKGIESSDSMKIRQTNQQASLVTIAVVLENLFEAVLGTYMWWDGREMDVEFNINKDFTPSMLDPLQIKAQMDLYLEKVITLEQLQDSLYKGEII